MLGLGLLNGAGLKSLEVAMDSLGLGLKPKGLYSTACM